AVLVTRCRRGPWRRSSSGWAASSGPLTRWRRRSLILLAYGRAARMRSWARRSLAAATSFIALVILCVDWTDRIRRWMSRRVGMIYGARDLASGRLDAARRHELGLRLADPLGQRVAQLVGQLLLVRDLWQELGVRALQVRGDELLEAADLLDGK